MTGFNEQNLSSNDLWLVNISLHKVKSATDIRLLRTSTDSFKVKATTWGSTNLKLYILYEICYRIDPKVKGTK